MPETGLAVTPEPLQPSKLKRFMVLLLATIAGAFGFVIGDLLLNERPGLPPVSDWTIWRHRVVIITVAAGLFMPAVLLEFCGAALADRIIFALRRLRACARIRWKGDRTREEFGKAEAGLFTSVAVVLCIVTLFFMPLPAFALLIMVAALCLHGRMIVSVCRFTGFNPVWATLVPAFYGAVAGYAVGW